MPCLRDKLYREATRSKRLSYKLINLISFVAFVGWQVYGNYINTMFKEANYNIDPSMARCIAN